MFHLTFCGGSEVRINEPDNTVFTMWGGTEIQLPTMAEKIRYVRGVLKQYGDFSDYNLRHTMVVSFMGGAAIRVPTIAREMEEMILLKESGLLTGEELQRIWKEVVAREDIDVIEKISIFGGCGEERPSRKDEIRDFERITTRGIISRDEAEELTRMLNGEQTKSTRRNLLQETLRSMFVSPASELPSSFFTSPSRSYITE